MALPFRAVALLFRYITCTTEVLYKVPARHAKHIESALNLFYILVINTKMKTLLNVFKSGGFP